MKIDVRHNFGDLKAKLDGMAKQVRYATAVALTRTAQDVRPAVYAEMRKVFDRPTPYTLRSLFVERATKETLTARVWIKDGYGTKKHYLNPQVFGGKRDLKRFEERLIRIGAMIPSERAVPGSSLALDAYGNVSRGVIVKILSQLGSRGVSGDYSMATNSRRSKAKRAVTSYFVSTGTRNTTRHLAPGIWQRTKFAQGSAIKPVFLFVKAHNYKKRLFFFEIGAKVINERFPVHFKTEFDKAMATAR